MKKGNKHGFTLVELLTVIAIIGILFVTLVSKVQFAQDRAFKTGVKNAFREFMIGTQMVSVQNTFSQIDTQEKFEAQLNKNMDKANAVTDGVSSAKDPWGKNYRMGYICDLATRKITIGFASAAGGNDSIAENFDVMDIAKADFADGKEYNFKSNILLTCSLDNGKITSTTEDDITAIKQKIEQEANAESTE